MTCLNLDIDFLRHPRTLRLRAKLGPGAELLPLELWCHCARYHAEDGVLRGYSAQELESACNWRGETGKAASAMLETGFIRQEADGAFSVPQWLEEQGHIAAFRKRAKAAAQKRWGDIPRGLRQNDAETTGNHAPSATPPDACGNASGNAASTASGIACGNAPTVPDQPDHNASDIHNKSMGGNAVSGAQSAQQQQRGPAAHPGEAAKRLKLVSCYKTFRGIKPGSGWDGQNLERNLRAAASLLAAFRGELRPAAQWLCGFGEKMDSSGLCWTLDTAARHAWDKG